MPTPPRGVVHTVATGDTVGARGRLHACAWSWQMSPIPTGDVGLNCLIIFCKDVSPSVGTWRRHADAELPSRRARGVRCCPRALRRVRWRLSRHEQVDGSAKGEKGFDLDQWTPECTSATQHFKVRPFAPTQQWQAQLHWEPEAVVIVTTTEVERVLPIDAGPSLMICLLNSARNAPLFYCQCQPPFFAANSDSSII